MIDDGDRHRADDAGLPDGLGISFRLNGRTIGTVTLDRYLWAGVRSLPWGTACNLILGKVCGMSTQMHREVIARIEEGRFRVCTPHKERRRG